VKRKIGWFILSSILILSLVLVSCGTKTTPITATTQPTTVPTTTSKPTNTTQPTTTSTSTTANWWDKLGVPKYGGTITLQMYKGPNDLDPYNYDSYGYQIAAAYRETLGTLNWALDRKIRDFKLRDRQAEFCMGLLAESWEQPEPLTFIFHIRKGINWQNKPPLNGRELTAYDIEFSYQRLFGKGYGFTVPGTYVKGAIQFAGIESITATDKYTVVFKWKTNSFENLTTLLSDIGTVMIVSPEEIKQYGNAGDPKHQVGTGPYMLDDYVSGSSASLLKNPDYWGYDERYPKNKLPYADTLRFLIIPDIATQLAAMRTGKIDILEDIDWQQAVSMAKTNPQILQLTRPEDGVSLDFRCDLKPFTDIRVRTALQMAIDLKTIAATYYGGTTEPIPYGLAGPAHKGSFTPYDQWPQEVKAGYEYNPDGAKKLLAEAGYPNGFTTNIVADATGDVEVLLIVKNYFDKIGVQMDVKTMDTAAYTAFIRAFKHDQMSAGTSSGTRLSPRVMLSRRYSNHTSNTTKNNDSIYDAIVDKYFASTTMKDAIQYIIQANDRALAQHWSVVLLPKVSSCLYQPWLKGYMGEAYRTGVHYARYWIDHNIK
jgi:peptide/nickel transport system substrate-binding protein